MRPFLDAVCRHKAAADIEKIVVRSYTSPDGTAAANKRLSAKRCKTISDLIIAETGIDLSLLHGESCGIAWDELARAVEADTRVPRRADVLRVLRTTLASDRNEALQALHGGVPYRWLYDNIFPGLRSAVALSLYVSQPVAVCQSADTVAVMPAEAADTIVVADNDTDSVSVAVIASDTIAVDRSVAHDDSILVPAEEPWHRLAIKSNLLYDAVLMPSLEVEYRFDDRWTVNAEAVVPWWHNDRKHKYFQIMLLSPEVRYWFKHYHDRPWHGFYAGILGGGGKYDLENGRRGYKGTGWFGGVSVGYMFPVGRNLSFEAGLGVGYLNTRYEEYLPIEGHYVYQLTKRTGYFGPLKLKFAIVWRLWDISKAKKGAAVQ